MVMFRNLAAFAATLIAALLLMGMLFISLYFSQDIINAIRKLSLAMRNLNGRQRALPDLNRNDELGQMGSDFLNMVNAIDQHAAHLEKQKSVFFRFVPSEFLQMLGCDQMTDICLDDQIKKEMTILFSDIRSFTAISEQRTPEATFQFLNAYLRHMSPVIHDHKGFIDKYIGDAIMALFGEAEHPLDGLQAAVAMQRSLATFNAQHAQGDFDPIRIGVGVHTGRLMLGTVGDQQRMQSTVISDAVNLCSRLEDLTKVYGCDIITTEAVIQHVTDRDSMPYRCLGKVCVKGKNEPVTIYEAYGADPEEVVLLKNGTLVLFEAGMEAYADGRMAEASMLFTEVLAANPADRTAKYFAEQADRALSQRPTRFASAAPQADETATMVPAAESF